MKRIFKLKKTEIIFILILVLIAMVFIIYNNYKNSGINNIKAYISYEDIVYEYELSEDKVFSIEELPNVVFEIRQGAIGFIHSDCPDKICIHSGMLDTPGESAACLPNKIILSIRGQSDTDLILN